MPCLPNCLHDQINVSWSIPVILHCFRKKYFWLHPKLSSFHYSHFWKYIMAHKTLSLSVWILRSVCVKQSSTTLSLTWGPRVSRTRSDCFGSWCEAWTSLNYSYRVVYNRAKRCYINCCWQAPEERNPSQVKSTKDRLFQLKFCLYYFRFISDLTFESQRRGFSWWWKIKKKNLA